MRKPVAQLHYITGDTKEQNLVRQVELACKGGVRWVQLRLKNKSETEIISIAKEVKAICKRYDAVFIVNDFVNIAMEVDADGIHVGRQDMAINDARKLLGNEKIIGGSTNSFEDIVKLSDYDIDYVGLGPLRFTTTKKNLNPVLGESGVKEILREVKNNKIQMPIIAIGGIQLRDIEGLITYGVHGIAVSSSINNADNIEIEAKKFVDACIAGNTVVEHLAG